MTFSRDNFAGDAGASGEKNNSCCRVASKATLTDLRNALLIDRQMVRQSGDQWFVDHR
jgi:hypothetical protein